MPTNKKKGDQGEKVWVVVDGVGQPCLRYVRHRGTHDAMPALPKELDQEYGPYRVARYRIVPEVEGASEPVLDAEDNREGRGAFDRAIRGVAEVLEREDLSAVQSAEVLHFMECKYALRTAAELVEQLPKESQNKETGERREAFEREVRGIELKSKHALKNAKKLAKRLFEGFEPDTEVNRDGERTQAELRLSVLWFAAKMEDTLTVNDHKSGWMGEDCDDGYLYKSMMKKLGELASEMFFEVGHNREVVAECVNISNYAMMIAERAWAFEQELEEEIEGKWA